MRRRLVSHLDMLVVGMLVAATAPHVTPEPQRGPQYSHNRAAEGMDLGRALVGSIEARAKLQHGIPEPPESENINGGGSEFGSYVTCHRPR